MRVSENSLRARGGRCGHGRCEQPAAYLMTFRDCQVCTYYGHPDCHGLHPACVEHAAEARAGAVLDGYDGTTYVPARVRTFPEELRS